MHRFSELAVAKRSVVLLLAGGLFLAGLLAWGSLKQELVPDVEFPIVTVIAPYPGAGAADVTEQVAKPIERAIGAIPGIDTIQSTSANSIALVIAEFDYGTDVREVTSLIEENLATAGLPASVTPQVTPFNINSTPVLFSSISATSADGLEAAARIAREEIVPELSAISGVAAVELTGGLQERLLITLDPVKLADAGISTQQVIGLLTANNLTFPGGGLNTGEQTIPVTTIGRFASVAEVRDLVVGVRQPAPGGPTDAPAFPQPITLADLGTVEIVAQATTGYGRSDGKPALSLTVSKTQDANTVEVAQAAQALLDEIAARHTDSLTVSTIADQSVFIIDSRDGLLREGGLGAIFAVVTIFLFLFSLRSTFVAAVSIPLSLLIALVGMQFSGISINIMTLGGLAVAVGRVVDDSIVVLENIYRHRALGDDRMTAVLRGPREVASAITASTLTTVAVFMPLGFAGGFISQFFLPFALTVTFALVGSLFVALTVIPVLAYLLMGRVSTAVDETGEPRNSLWVHVYDPTIRFALRNRWTKLGVVALSAALFVGSLALVPLLPTQFLSSGSEKILRVTVAPPSGASSAAVLERAIEAEAILIDDPMVEQVQTTVPGEGDTGFQTLFAAQSGRPANSAVLTVRLDSTVDLVEYAVTLAEDLDPVRGDGFDVAVGQQGGATSNALTVIVTASDPGQVETATAALMDALGDLSGFTNLTTDLVRAAPEIQVRVDPNKAVALGTTAAQIGAEVRGALTGQTVSRIQFPDSDPLDVVVRIDPAATASLADLESLPVGTVARASLGTVATVEQVEVQGTITRIDQAPSASVKAEITSEDTGAVSASVQAVIDDLKASGAIPAGVSVELAGVSQQQAEAFGGLFAAMGIAILLVFVMLVFTFNSLITPFIILFSLPLATIGAFPALVLTGRPIGVSALIGFLMLIGIVVTNAIVLLDLVERLKADGHSTRDALVEGGKTRVRPILMTAIATILALVPLAAGFNEGSIIAAELGTVVIGGLLSSTFLTLIVVPVVYSLVDGVKARLRRRPSTVGAAVTN
ncbi:MAG: efflux RND transporter permease subunit [Chloroflexota bacterium]|nr:efflux RND transporter permease subunit [Chloroflexota bacterium]